MPKAITRRIINLPALPDVPITIKRVSVKHIGLSAAMELAEKNNLAALAARNAAEGGQLVNSVSDTPPRPPEQPREVDDVLLRLKSAQQVQIGIARAGLVEPDYEALCEMYGADPENPWDEMAGDFDHLCEQIMAFSAAPAQFADLLGGSPAQRETFPDAARGTS